MSSVEAPVSRARKNVSELPPETLDFAAKVFEFARDGQDEILSLYLNAGLPPNLTNNKGLL